MNLTFSPCPELSTPRLHLRKLELLDAPFLFRMRSNPEVMRFVPRPLHTTVEESKALIELILANLRDQEGITWAICLHGDPALIGAIGLWKIDKPNYRAEIGYMLHSDHWGKGYATEALEAVEAVGFKEMNLHRIESHLGPDHAASIRVLEKRGFVKEAHFRENFFYEGKFLDTLVYGKVRHYRPPSSK